MVSNSFLSPICIHCISKHCINKPKSVPVSTKQWGQNTKLTLREQRMLTKTLLKHSNFV